MLQVYANNDKSPYHAVAWVRNSALASDDTFSAAVYSAFDCIVTCLTLSVHHYCIANA